MTVAKPMAEFVLRICHTELYIYIYSTYIHLIFIYVFLKDAVGISDYGVEW
jgi:hypothetical protein